MGRDQIEEEIELIKFWYHCLLLSVDIAIEWNCWGEGFLNSERLRMKLKEENKDILSVVSKREIIWSILSVSLFKKPAFDLRRIKIYSALIQEQQILISICGNMWNLILSRGVLRLRRKSNTDEDRNIEISYLFQSWEFWVFEDHEVILATEVLRPSSSTWLTSPLTGCFSLDCCLIYKSAWPSPWVLSRSLRLNCTRFHFLVCSLRSSPCQEIHLPKTWSSSQLLPVSHQKMHRLYLQNLKWMTTAS